MEITKATEADIDEILKLQTQIYRTSEIAPEAKSALEEQLRDETCDILAAKDNGKVVGTVTIYYIQVAVRAKHYALFEGLVVDESERGKGTGTKLFQECIDYARKKNCYKIIFTSGTDRAKAHKFYEKMGFKKWGLEFRMDL